MPISVVTGGPQGVEAPAIDGTVLTFQSMADAVADDIDDTQGEYTGQIQKAIFSAIRYCEREPYYFNETRDITFATVSGQEWYGAADSAQIPKLVAIQELYLEGTTLERRCMSRTYNEEIERFSDNTADRGEPYEWAYFNRQIRLYPIPDRLYTVRMQINPYRLDPIVNAEDTNAWFTEAFDMIKARAKYILNKDTLKDAAMAAEALNDFQDAKDSLKAETSRRSSVGRIVATCW